MTTTTTTTAASDTNDTIQTLHHLIGSEKQTAGERTGQVYNPATGKQTGELPFATATTLSHAVDVAEAAQPGWRDTGMARRAAVMFRLREIISTRKDELAAVITAEHGKVLDDAAGEIDRGLENVEFCAGLVHHMKGESLEQAASGVDVSQIRQPVGVVGCVTPFNFPAMVPLWMVTTAIAAGNAVILKPSEKVPSAALWIAEAFREAGLPDGILNVVHGDKEAVDAILDEPRIKAVSFVGSTPIAKSIYTRAATNGKRVQALGGAKNHMVVMPDADLDSAADAAISAGYGSAGERCMAVSVLVAVGDVADELVDKVAARMGDITVCNGVEKGADMGPIVTEVSRDRIESIVAGAAEEGARVVVDGREHDLPSEGFFTGPTLVDDVTPGMRVYDEEIFGPVLSVVRVDSYDEAVALINSSRFANGTAVFTRDGRTARQFKYDIEVGMVGVNVPIPVPIGAFSFGGWKDSLFGDTHMYGPESFNFYTRRKVVTERWPLPSESQIDLGFPTN
ncbi:CoA-acylating methylmalonate-semialdehyde dehydrogenase [Corynebacterium sp.]|uniref:CoA-acylating methylmalonate-semialdehyde dehydrogenase n=1 Tax=Corynebacterium sp. TaxID=1720 RepID=UPI0026487172|nr:CoA-acylating methylmalonate-semialdehyde dehydrogenase [Corynebacterium sp.]MDN5720159.1 CoA-acylating methylmalonate-semialdehyde dehydrogenase [Corynebacterium sp.]